MYSIYIKSIFFSLSLQLPKSEACQYQLVNLIKKNNSSSYVPIFFLRFFKLKCFISILCTTLLIQCFSFPQQFFFYLATSVIMRAALEVTGEWISTVCRGISLPVWLIFPSVWKQVDLHPWAPHLRQMRLSGPRLFSSYSWSAKGERSQTQTWPNGNLTAGCSSQLGSTRIHNEMFQLCSWYAENELHCGRDAVSPSPKTCTWRLMMKWSNKVSPSLSLLTVARVDRSSQLDCLCTMQPVHFE